mmetsp:Transcript_27954/g.70719  ORF Transcript_27954/g.70719 Transcript_27954/m.70719 type:complete len:756 (+) Transcript_27954:330-2597(+)
MSTSSVDHLLGVAARVGGDGFLQAKERRAEQPVVSKTDSNSTNYTNSNTSDFISVEVFKMGGASIFCDSVPLDLTVRQLLDEYVCPTVEGQCETFYGDRMRQILNEIHRDHIENQVRPLDERRGASPTIITEVEAVKHKRIILDSKRRGPMNVIAGAPSGQPAPASFEFGPHLSDQQDAVAYAEAGAGLFESSGARAVAEAAGGGAGDLLGSSTTSTSSSIIDSEEAVPVGEIEVFTAFVAPVEVCFCPAPEVGISELIYSRNGAATFLNMGPVRSTRDDSRTSRDKERDVDDNSIIRRDVVIGALATKLASRCVSSSDLEQDEAYRLCSSLVPFIALVAENNKEALFDLLLSHFFPYLLSTRKVSFFQRTGSFVVHMGSPLIGVTPLLDKTAGWSEEMISDAKQAQPLARHVGAAAQGRTAYTSLLVADDTRIATANTTTTSSTVVEASGREMNESERDRRGHVCDANPQKEANADCRIGRADCEHWLEISQIDKQGYKKTASRSGRRVPRGGSTYTLCFSSPADREVAIGTIQHLNLRCARQSHHSDNWSPREIFMRRIHSDYIREKLLLESNSSRTASGASSPAEALEIYDLYESLAVNRSYWHMFTESGQDVFGALDNLQQRPQSVSDSGTAATSQLNAGSTKETKSTIAAAPPPPSKTDPQLLRKDGEATLREILAHQLYSFGGADDDDLKDWASDSPSFRDMNNSSHSVSLWLTINAAAFPDTHAIQEVLSEEPRPRSHENLDLRARAR